MDFTKDLIQKYLDNVITYRRHIHENPELGEHEVNTSAYVEQILHEIGIPTTKGYGGYGVVGLIQGRKGESPCVALRADMDALPIQEETGLPFASKNPGVMHACGHDVHTAILLGCAHVLYEMRDQFDGVIKLIFQAAEETPFRGAIPSIADGILENPKVDAAFALHVWPEYSTGYMSVRDGAMMAASARFNLKVIGKSGHAAQPHLAVDSIAIAAQLVTAIQQIVSRRIDPNEPCVITFGKISGGTIYNQIAADVTLEGTCRTFSLDVMRQVEEEIHRVAHGITEAFGATYELNYSLNSHPTINDHEMFLLVQSVLQPMLQEKLVLQKYPNTGSEDFGSYGEHIPTCYMGLGCTKEGAKYAPLHNHGLIVDENAIPVGMEAMCKIALQYLKTHAGE